MWILVLTESNGKYKAGAYVAVQGSEHAYTYQLERARRFTTRAQAEAAKCGNEAAREM